MAVKSCRPKQGSQSAGGAAVSQGLVWACDLNGTGKEGWESRGRIH